ncbi:Structure-specific endonuclease subunit slx1 [Penicillium diatomitis]|uniref:Structure-specific endonuclease subunit slx1 n=1 Tax=Penicillium diatomitis TaxID=2819901 RepID=A0A9W9XLJ3_9EURO|nr:Structure-specific endonuclease subunit slx1 [Penicillium diatomitis]KAJ5495261.1 Structure-specific endonuclease subunit slx1 [Penicillium diatomitis]
MENATAAGTVSGLPVDYTNLEGYLEKSKFLLEDTTDNECSLCNAPILPTREQIVVCSQDECRGAHHLLCLSDAFLKGTPGSDIAVPISGACPTCGCVVQWTLMMQELSLRNRGENAVLAILDKKARRDRKARAAEASSRRHIANEAEVMVNERDHQTRQHSENASMDDDNLLSEDWYEGLDLESDTDHRVPGNGIASPPTRLEIVIEDSEWDDAEIID